MSSTQIFLRLALFAAAAGSLHAQFAFSYRSLVNPAPVTVGNNGTIALPGALVGTPTAITLIGQNTSADPWRITSVAVSSTAFKPGPAPSLVPPQNSFTLDVSFTPASVVQTTATLTINATSAAAGPAPPSAVFNFFLVGGGLAPQLVSSYILNPDGNQVALQDSDSIIFPPTTLNATATATFVIVNRGNGPGTVRSATLSGTPVFKISGLPLLPAQVDPNKDLRFTLSFTPVVRDPASASLRVDLGDRVLNIGVTGQGSGAVLSYEFSAGDTTAAVNPGDTLHLPGAGLGATATGVVRVRNTGNSDARVAAISISGPAFSIVNQPPLPATVAQGGALSITLAFNPKDSGLSTGRLLVDAAAFNVDGMGTGSKLTYSSRVGSTVAPIADGGSLSFPNTIVGESSSVSIQVTNSGNAPASVSAVGAVPAVFGLKSMPALPVTVAPGQTTEFAVEFTPTSTGAITGTLQIDDRAIPLRAVGAAPPALPAVSFTGLPDSLAPLQQPSVGLTLEQPYVSDLSGKLILAFTPDSVVDDPSVQFASGGRSIDFRIPANTTQAVFGDSGKSVQFQTGTLAGSIALSASFAVRAMDITPPVPPGKSVLLPADVPQIRNVRLGSRTANSFELLITGFSTTRSVNQFALTFTPAPGANLATTSLNIDVTGPFTSWYQSDAAKPFGGQFTASVTINAAGDIAAVQSVSVTVTNARGTSTPVSVNVQ